jgi:hypothetical protein
MAHPPSESANERTNPASSRNLKPPALAGGVFTNIGEGWRFHDRSVPRSWPQRAQLLALGFRSRSAASWHARREI